jgi:hypothetical protein
MCSEVWGHPDTGGLVGVAPRVTSGGAVASRQGSAINPGATPAPVIMLAKIPEEFLSPGCEPTAIAGLEGGNLQIAFGSPDRLARAPEQLSA